MGILNPQNVGHTFQLASFYWSTCQLTWGLLIFSTQKIGSLWPIYVC